MSSNRHTHLLRGICSETSPFPFILQAWEGIPGIWWAMEGCFNGDKFLQPWPQYTMKKWGLKNIRWSSEWIIGKEAIFFSFEDSTSLIWQLIQQSNFPILLRSWRFPVALTTLSVEFRSATHGKGAVVFVVNVMLLSGTELQNFWLRILGFGQLFSSFQYWVLDPVSCVCFFF